MTTFGAVAKRGGGWLPVIGATALAGTLGALALPAVLGRTVDAIIAGDGSRTWITIAAGLVVLGLLSEIVGAFASTACVAGTTAWLRNRLVRHVLAVSPERSRRFESGDLVSRVSSDAGAAAEAGPALVTVATSVLPPVGSVVMLAVIDPWLAVAFLAGLALVAAVLWAFTRNTADIMTSYQQVQGRLAATLAESLSGSRTIAAAGTVEREEQRVLGPLPDLHALGSRTWQVLARAVAQSAVVGPLVIVVVVAVAGVQLARGLISAGDVLAASQYAVLGAGLGGLTGMFAELARARAGVRRAAEVLTLDPAAYGHSPLPAGEGRLEFRDVTVRADDSILLDGVDLALPGAATVAVVGRSGAGKSTLAALAARLRDPDQGEVLLDGVPLPELPRPALRAAVACAFERPVLVGETVEDAVGFGASRARVEQAARATYAHDFVSRLPDGYDTPLDETPMSGGERQRLGLARAWHASRLLVLDDATSSLDTATEMQISRTLTAASAVPRSRIIVTHRAATAARADVVVWLEDGRVRAVGPHDQLWAKAGYREVFG